MSLQWPVEKSHGTLTRPQMWQEGRRRKRERKCSLVNFSTEKKGVKHFNFLEGNWWLTTFQSVQRFKPPIYLHLIFEISSVTWFFFQFRNIKFEKSKNQFDFEIEFCRLHPQQKLSSNFTKNQVCFKIDFFFMSL